jgi:hypothetical protein
MNAAMIAQLLIQFGPGAISLIQQLISIWEKPALTIEEVTKICAVAQKSYDDYIAESGGDIKILHPA